MAPSTLAGIITASATVFVALIGAGATVLVAFMLRNTHRVEAKVESGNAQIAEVHVIVNQQRTDMQQVIVNQQRQLMALESSMAAAGMTIPITTESTGEPIVATAVIVHEELHSEKPPEAQGGSDVE